MGVGGFKGRGVLTEGEVPPMIDPRSSGRRVILASILALIVVAAGVVVWITVPRSPGSSPGPPAEGLTFGEAYAAGTNATDGAVGAPWTLYSALGVVSPLPVWTDPLGEATCRALPGISIWNASQMPRVEGQYASGVAPFWSLIYENATRYVVDVVTVNTTLHLVGPLAPTSPCGSAMDVFLGNVTVGAPIDSPAAASFAWSVIGSTYLSNNSEAWAYYQTGSAQLPLSDSEPGGWVVAYAQCGLPGHTGSTYNTSELLKFLSPGGEYYKIRQVAVCSNGAFQLTYGTPTNSSGPRSSTVTRIPISLGFNGSTNTTDGSGLLTGATSIDLQNSTTGAAYAPTHLACSIRNLSVSSCGGPGGWYGVLTLPTGYWLDAFGDVNGTLGWLLPNVPFYTGDSIVIVSNGILGAQGVRLTVHSAEGDVSVSGATTI